jgi:hypothetical protein
LDNNDAWEIGIKKCCRQIPSMFTSCKLKPFILDYAPFLPRQEVQSQEGCCWCF